MHGNLKKRHLLAFFCFRACLLLAVLPASAEEGCNTPITPVVLTIKSVIDGDTVISADNTHIRLIGIDTPEIDYRGDHTEPLAYEARDFLGSLIKVGEQILAQYDAERTDQYDRTLAHLFLPDGTNIQLRLLQEGLAVPVTYAPNIRYSRCYYQAADTARDQHHGLWGLPGYQPMVATALPPNAQGYRFIQMTVKDIKHSKHSLTISTFANLVILIPGSSLYLFDSVDINHLVGNQITVQGELFRDGERYRMLLRHPLQMTLE